MLLIVGCESKDGTSVGAPFEKLSSEYTGIDFSNIITPNLESSENLFDYDYFYNGSGVGIADINNDGLKDIIFTANQTENKLYLNKGNLKFEDITKPSNINPKNKKWSSGVTFADVNNAKLSMRWPACLLTHILKETQWSTLVQARASPAFL